MKSGGIKRMLTLGVFVLCGLVLTGVDQCEDAYVTGQTFDGGQGAANPAVPDGTAGLSNPASDTAAGTGSTGAARVSGISGKEWKLSGLRKGGAVITIDRDKLQAGGFGDFFTLTIDSRRISGKAAPNRYTTTYQAGAGNVLALAPPVSTLMASMYDPEHLREDEYFQYLAKVTGWKLNQGKLELYTTDPAGTETVLVYGD
ncbi:MAG: META domain-containing protein [Treponema sp.]|jgi:heat shock protein HslJ|nr:META domain-containing protein [Treponema sp.]